MGDVPSPTPSPASDMALDVNSNSNEQRRRLRATTTAEKKAQKPPMMVMVTWDDGVQCSQVSDGCTQDGTPLYLQELIEGLSNPNGSPYRFTFFTTQTATAYDVVENLYANGHEIAGHTVTHGNDQGAANTYFPNMNASNAEAEVAGQRDIILSQTNIRMRDIKGYRCPDLAAGEEYRKQLYKHNFTYDSSLGTIFHAGEPNSTENLPVWPYTLDWGGSSRTYSAGSPANGPLPMAYNGLWEIPLNPLLADGHDCGTIDTCRPELAMYPFAGMSQTEVAAGFQWNFQRAYTTNRAPLGIFLHTAWLKDAPAGSTTPGDQTRKGLRLFLESLAKYDDVWVVTPTQVLQWMQAQGKAAAAAATFSSSTNAGVSFPDPNTLFVPPTDRPKARCAANAYRPCQGGQRHLLLKTGEQIMSPSCVYWKTCNRLCPNNFPWIDDIRGDGPRVGPSYNPTCKNQYLTSADADTDADERHYRMQVQEWLTTEQDEWRDAASP